MKTKYLLILAFVSGMAVMAFEVSASRLLAPFFGTSLFVWSNILGVVLLSLAVGYYIGGKISDKYPSQSVLVRMMVFAGFFFLVVPLLVQPLASIISINTMFLCSGAVIIFISSLIVTLLLFSLPLIILGMVSPYIIKLYSESGLPIGEVSGSVFAISTVGSILGTFLPSLWLIPWLGTKRTIMIFAIILILTAGFGLFKKKVSIFLLLLITLPMPVLADNTVKEDVLYETESVYQYIQVQESNDQTRYLIFNEGEGVQSMYKKDRPLTGGFYYDYYNLLPYLTDANDRQAVLILGLAGGSISRQLHYFFPGQVAIDGVEIDKKVIEIAKQYFELENSDLTIHNFDARLFMNSTEKKYDIIISDAYSKQLYISWELTTREFWQILKKHLNENGVLAININAVSTDSELLTAVANTMASVFEYTYITPTIGYSEWNYMILASSKPIDFEQRFLQIDQPLLMPYAKKVIDKVMPVRFRSSAMILTDDKAPVELMTDKMIYSYLLFGE